MCGPTALFELFDGSFKAGECNHDHLAKPGLRRRRRDAGELYEGNASRLKSRGRRVNESSLFASDSHRAENFSALNGRGAVPRRPVGLRLSRAGRSALPRRTRSFEGSGPARQAGPTGLRPASFRNSRLGTHVREILFRASQKAPGSSSVPPGFRIRLLCSLLSPLYSLRRQPLRLHGCARRSSYDFHCRRANRNASRGS
jgi:hypothetical protein